MLKIKKLGLISLVAVFGVVPLSIKTGASTYERLALAPNFNRAAGIVTGFTGGSFSLSSIANRDRQGNVCIGYGDPTPDHVMVLESHFSKLTLQVNSGGKDTTLVIQGPDNTVRCHFGSNSRPDAVIHDTNWSAGEYRIWVGSIEAGQRWRYSLSVSEN